MVIGSIVRAKATALHLAQMAILELESKTLRHQLPRPRPPPCAYRTESNLANPWLHEDSALLLFLLARGSGEIYA